MAYINENRVYIHTPNSRRYFWWTLFLSYFIVTSIVLFRALGYSFDFGTNIFVHTGSINVKAEPRNVSVLIDGKEPRGRYLNFINDSYHVTSIGHGEHTVEFSAPGYKTWQEEVTIRSGFATEFWNILLVREDYEETAHAITNPDGLFFAPGFNKVAFAQNADDNRILLTTHNIEESALTQFGTFPATTYDTEVRENIEWSPDQERLTIPVRRTQPTPQLIDTTLQENDPVLATRRETIEEPQSIAPQSDYLIARQEDTAFDFAYLSSYIAAADERDAKQEIIAAQEEQGITLTEAELEALYLTTQDSVEASNLEENDSTVSHVRWRPDKSDTIYLLRDTQLESYTLLDFSAERTIIADGIAAYDFSDDGIYLLDDKGTLLRDNSYDGTDTEAIAQFPDFVTHDAHRIITYDKNRVVHLDDTNGILSLFNKQGDETVTRKLRDGVRAARFSDDGKKLLYHTDFSIYTYFTREWPAQPFREPNSLYEIFTFDTPITSLDWTPDYEHVLAGSDGRLQLIDLDHRGDHNLTEVLTFTQGTVDPIMDASNNRIFYPATNGDDVEMRSIIFPREKGIFN